MQPVERLLGRDQAKYEDAADSQEDDEDEEPRSGAHVLGVVSSSA